LEELLSRAVCSNYPALAKRDDPLVDLLTWCELAYILGVQIPDILGLEVEED
jgi:hypothetical protein